MIGPRIRCIPPALSTRGPELVALGERLGFTLHPWQILAANDILATVEDGTLAAYEAALVVSRQNGKSLIAELYALLFALEGQAVLYTAQRSDAAKEVFQRLLADMPEELGAEAVRTNGKEEIKFDGGGRIVFRTRGPRVGRAFSFHKLICDEAQHLTQEELDAATPTLRTSKDAQTLYMGTAANGRTNPYARILWDLRVRAREGRGRRLAYLEWSPDCRGPDGVELAADELPEEMLDDPERWLHGTPAMESGLITLENMQASRESRLGDPVGFAVEYMNVFVPPDVGGGGGGLVDADDFMALTDPESEIKPAPKGEQQEILIAFDMNEHRLTHLNVVGRREDALLDLSYVGAFEGAARASAAIRKIVDRDDVYLRGIACDGSPQNLDLMRQLERDGIGKSALLTEHASQEGAAACGHLVDAVAERRFRHRGQLVYLTALRGAVIKSSSDWWVYDRQRSTTDVSPLLSAAVALHAGEGRLSKEQARFDIL